MKQSLVASPRRWLVLISFMLVTIVCEIQWLVHASVSRAAAAELAGQFDPSSLFNVDFFAILYLVGYLLFCLPASWVINRFGLGIGTGIGSVLLIAGSVGKAVFCDSFGASIVFQALLSISQPFLINAVTALVMRWFPQNERGTAAGLGVLAQYLGIAVALGLTPAMVVTDPLSASYGQGLDTAMWAYAVAAVVCGVAALLFVRDPGSARPVDVLSDQPIEPFVTAPIPVAIYTGGFFKDIARILAKRDMLLTLILFFIGLGIVNCLTSMVDAVTATIGVRDSDGLIGIVLIGAGIVGAAILPVLSDKFRKRKLFLIICAIGIVPGMTGLAVVKYFNPYHYSWSVYQSPEPVNIKTDAAHPSFIPDKEGVYRFHFGMSEGGAVKEERDLTVLVDLNASAAIKNDASLKNGGQYAQFDIVMAPQQAVLLDASHSDDQIVSVIYLIAIISAGLLGFCLLAAGPLGFQYAAEVTHPLPEASSQGLLLLAGQISGIAFTAGMTLNHYAGVDAFLLVFAGLSAIVLLIAFLIKESPMIATVAAATAGTGADATINAEGNNSRARSESGIASETTTSSSKVSNK